MLRENAHLDSSTSSNHFPIFYSSFDDHDSIMQAPFHLLDELLSTTT